jgi:outer membrane receptor protein involved in Fe transport
MTWSLNGNYTDQQTRTAQGVTYDRAGALGSSPDSYASGIPKLRAILAATYQEGPWSLTAQGRFIGSARLTNGPQGQAAIRSASLSPAGVLTRGDIFGLVDDNSIGAVGYLDLRGSYRIDEHFQIYGAVDNLNNATPPAIPSTSGGNGTNQMVYDAIGRAIRLGVRVMD